MGRFQGVVEKKLEEEEEEEEAAFTLGPYTPLLCLHIEISGGPLPSPEAFPRWVRSFESTA